MKSYNIFLKDGDVVLLNADQIKLDGNKVVSQKGGTINAIFNLDNIMGIYEVE